MKEELYIITDSGRVQLDLNTPSGITLNFKSNILGDFSNITCSHSYTFKLPMTNHNRSVLDIADDIRHNSGMIRKKLRAEYLVDGVRLFTDANLYIDNISTYYQAAMTWNVVRGLQTLKDSGMKLTDIDSTYETMVEFGDPDGSAIESMSNEDKCLKPIYDAGVMYFPMEADPIFGICLTYYSKDQTAANGWAWLNAYPLPVTPIRYVINRINQIFGTNIIFGRKFNYSELTDDENEYVPDEYDLINRGVIPLIDKNITKSQAYRLALQIGMGGISYTHLTTSQLKEVLGFGDTDIEIHTVILHNFSIIPSSDSPIEIRTITVSDFDVPAALYSKTAGVDYKVYGYIDANFSDMVSDPKLSIYELRGVADEDGGFVKSKELVEVGTVKGRMVNMSAGHWIFDFREDKTEGILLSGLQSRSTANFASGSYTDFDPLLIIAFNHDVSSITATEDFRFIPDYSNCIVPHKMDFSSNLPDITLMDFMKSLYFMAGAFPSVTADGSIVPVFFNDIERNKSVALDWTDKAFSQVSLPEKVQFSCGGFKQKNYYMTASDNLDGNEKDQNDKYEDGIGTISVKNETLDASQTVIQIPFNAPYVYNRKNPFMSTGKTFKAWTFEDSTLSFSAPDPIIGVLKYVPGLIVDSRGDSKKKIYMTCWNGFASLTDNPSYAYLQKMMDNPYVITEYLNLTEFDLRDLDFSVPVYLGKYSAYFAVVSIQRDGNGRCKCELLKLP